VTGSEPGARKQQLLQIVKSTSELTREGLEEWGREIERKAPEESMDDQASGEQQFENPKDWKLWDLGDVDDWPAPPLEWIVEPLIPKGGIGFLSGAPKDGKSLLTIDLCIHLAHSLAEGKKWLGKFQCNKSKVLYIAREDPIRRIKERSIEIIDGYDLGVSPRDCVKFLIRERFDLMDDRHIAWVSEVVQEHCFDILILDVLNRMIPGLDELSAKDMASMVSVLERLNRELGLTVLNLDHTRKPTGPQSGRNKQAPNPFDLKGSIAKYGAADFMLCLSRTKQDGRLQLYCENKDSDERPHFLIDVSPKGSDKPKFSFVGDVKTLASDMKAKGEENLKKVFGALGTDWNLTTEIARRVGLVDSTTRKHLNTLLDQGKAECKGETKGKTWRMESAKVLQHRAVADN